MSACCRVISPPPPSPPPRPYQVPSSNHYDVDLSYSNDSGEALLVDVYIGSELIARSITLPPTPKGDETSINVTGANLDPAPLRYSGERG